MEKNENIENLVGVGSVIGWKPVFDNKKVGVELKSKRIAKNVTVTQIARGMKFTTPYIYDLEKGNRGWSIELINKYLTIVNGCWEKL